MGFTPPRYFTGEAENPPTEDTFDGVLATSELLHVIHSVLHAQSFLTPTLAADFRPRKEDE